MYLTVDYRFSCTATDIRGPCVCFFSGVTCIDLCLALSLPLFILTCTPRPRERITFIFVGIGVDWSFPLSGNRYAGGWWAVPAGQLLAVLHSRAVLRCRGYENSTRALRERASGAHEQESPILVHWNLHRWEPRKYKRWRVRLSFFFFFTCTATPFQRVHLNPHLKTSTWIFTNEIDNPIDPSSKPGQ